MKRTLFIVTIFIALFFRFYQFGHIPPSLNRDEAALGYNAFAIAAEGIDEWGNMYPLTFKSFGDYKLPGYIYTTSLLIHILGPSDQIVRFPSMLAGLGIIALTYLITKRVFKNEHVSIACVVLVAVQPWAVFYSRMAYEANLGIFLLLLSLWLFLQPRLIFWIFGTLSYLAAILTYNTPLLLLPIILLLLILQSSSRKQKVVTIIGIVSVGIAGLLLLSSVTAQKKAITLWSDPTLVDMQAKLYAQSFTLPEKMWNHKYTFFSRVMMTNFIRSWQPNFLVIRGGQNPWHSVPGGSHVYLVVYLAAFYGIFKSFKRFYPWVIAILGSLLPAIITVDAPHATRSLLFLWLLTVFAGYGVSKLPKLLTRAAVVILLGEISLFGYRYFCEFPNYSSTAWHVGIREAIQAAAPQYQNGQTIQFISQSGDLAGEQLYIYPLWYLRTLPSHYIQSVTMSPPDNVNMIRVHGFERIDISPATSQDSAVTIERQKNGSYQ